MQLTVRPKAMLFDLDGTLADTLPQLHEAAIKVAHDLKCIAPSAADMKSYVGNGVMMLLVRMLAHDTGAKLEDTDPDLLAKARAKFNQYYALGLKSNFTVFDGVYESLKQWRAQGIKLAVVTNKPMMFAAPLLDYMHLTEAFDFILGGEILKERKPDPTPLFYALGKIDVNPSRALMVGDSVNDILGGQNAGMSTAAFTYGYNGGRDVRLSHPDYVFDHFSELTAMVSLLKA